VFIVGPDGDRKWRRNGLQLEQPVDAAVTAVADDLGDDQAALDELASATTDRRQAVAGVLH
jgi:hypothetical protein